MNGTTAKGHLDVAQRRAIQEIYFDKSLSPSEKKERILAIQGPVHADSDSENMSIFTTKSTSQKANSSNSNRGHDIVKNGKRKNETKEAKAKNEAATVEESKTKSLPAYSNSLHSYDAMTGLNSQKNQVERLQHQHEVAPMEDVESIINAEENASTKKSIGVKNTQMETRERFSNTPSTTQKANPQVDMRSARSSGRQVIQVELPTELKKSRSNATKTHASSTEHYDSAASVDSSIDTNEQNREIMMKSSALNDDDRSVKTYSYRIKRACGFCCCCLILLAVLLSPIVYLLRDWFAKTFAPLLGDKEADGDGGVEVITLLTKMPTSSPTKDFLYDPPSVEDCRDIATGFFPNDDAWQLRKFEVPMDVSLEYETTDVESMAQMLVSHLQSDLAPVLTGCTHVVGESFLRRRMSSTQFVIGNAVMSAFHEASDVCAIRQRTCYRVMVEMSLYIKGRRTKMDFQTIITEALETTDSLVTQLDLPSPFNTIQVQGVFPTFSTESPTTRPTARPSARMTLSPTTAPVKAVTLSPTQDVTAPPTTRATPGPTKKPTPTPTAAPVDCKKTLKQVLQSNGVSQLNNNAFQWMVTTDQWNCNGNEVSIVDRYAMASLYFSLIGDQWLRKTQWMTSVSVCKWQGVGCDAKSIAITALQLSGNQLIGALPTELGLLTGLTSLDMGGNGLSSSILPQLSNLVHLKTLNLANNALSGQVPAEISNLVNLESLKIDTNQLNGALMTQIGQMSRLSELTLSENHISGQIPTEIARLSVLSILNLASNKFSLIPTQLSQLVSLKSLELSANKLKGEIPDLQGMAQLTLLRIDNNKLSGDIPVLPSSLITCNLSKNKFKGDTNNAQGVCILD